MEGRIVKEQLLKVEKSLAEAARKLGTSNQNLVAKLSSPDIKTGFIEQLSKIYGLPVSYFMGLQDSLPSCSLDSAMASRLMEEIAAQRRIIETAQGQIQTMLALLGRED